MERPSSRTNSMPARLGTINCGASAHSSTSTLTRLPVSGSVSLRSAASTSSAYESMYGSTTSGQLGEEREPQVAVARLRHDEQPGRVPVGADQRAERGPGLTGGGERHEDQGALGQVPVPDGGEGLGAAGARRPPAGRGW